MKISSFEVKGLYGAYNHKVPFNRDMGAVIIHGPNGVGKTATLRLINSFLSGNYDKLLVVDFDEILISFSDKRVCSILRAAGPDSSRSLKYSIYYEGKKKTYHEILSDRHMRNFRTLMTRSRLKKAKGGVPSKDSLYSKVVYNSSIYDFEIDGTRTALGFSSLRETEYEDLARIREENPVRFVETSRLYRLGELRKEDGIEVTFEETVVRYASEIKSHIQSAQAEYGRYSQQLDQSFPYRLMTDEVVGLGDEDIISGLAKLESQQAEYKNIGLLEGAGVASFDKEMFFRIPDSKRVPISLFLRDSESKLQVLRDVYEKINFLISSLNSKFKNKKVITCKDNGLVVESRGRSLDVSGLSSGEQHEFVMLYELLFKTPKGAVVLIDEPELSLHVTWQKMFLPEIISIAKRNSFFTIIATHSPYIVSGRFELMVELNGGEGVEL